jgi:hypothetical protein
MGDGGNFGVGVEFEYVDGHVRFHHGVEDKIRG